MKHKNVLQKINNLDIDRLACETLYMFDNVLRRDTDYQLPTLLFVLYCFKKKYNIEWSEITDSFSKIEAIYEGRIDDDYHKPIKALHNYITDKLK